jgi:serpin B
MAKRNIVRGLACVALCIAGCSNQALPTTKPAETGTVRQALKDKVVAIVEADNRFAFDLYQRFRGDETKNLVFSPASISTGLAMTIAGAAGDTEIEMAKTLHFEIPQPELHKQMGVLLASWERADEKREYRLNVANRLWGQVGLSFRPDFLQITGTDYGAKLGLLDLNHEPGQARQTMNAWVKDRTEGKITNLLTSDEPLRDARLVLTSALYFKGAWYHRFYKQFTKSDDFYVSAHRTVKAQMMVQNTDLRYAHPEGIRILDLAYGHGNFSMHVLLPDAVDGLSLLENKLTDANLKTWIRNLALQDVNVDLPRFKTTSQFQLSDTLKLMGMVSAFDPMRADFSRMDGKRDLFLSAVVHKAYVDVNEEGTEAAAAIDALAVGSPDEPENFRANHPFVYLIRDNRTGAILFLGRIIDPTQ